MWRYESVLMAALVPLLVGCSSGSDPVPDVYETSDSPAGEDLQPGTGAPDHWVAPDHLQELLIEPDNRGETAPDTTAPDVTEVQDPPLESCGFEYDFAPWVPAVPPVPSRSGPEPTAPDQTDAVDTIAHAEPDPPATFLLPARSVRADIVMPEYSDDMPLFPRAGNWNGAARCFERPDGARMLLEDEAFDLYQDIAQMTTGVHLDSTPGRRSVVGLRGAYPGTFAWNGNPPDRFNDTLVLLWVEPDGTKRVREFAAHTDTGAFEFGWHNSSSLRPNRRYLYQNGWHKSYNALQISEWNYQVRDDANKNGHWDSDRNGWLPPTTAEDHDRTGSGHNIHLASVDSPLGEAQVKNWSAGCQTIPGIINWTEFITHAWTGMGDPVDYFLVDVRDIDPMVWVPCEPDGTHQCPHRIQSFPYTHTGDTSVAASDDFNVYNCSPADESGPEVVYVLTLEQAATVHAELDDVGGQGPDIDIHLLDGWDPKACLMRDNVAFSLWVPPGRYYILADTFVEAGVPLAGKFQLDVWLAP